jgi:type III secretory pathway component EscT
MALAIWFWIILVLGVIFTGVRGFATTQQANPRFWAFDNLISLILLIILGIAVFGGPIK